MNHDSPPETSRTRLGKTSYHGLIAWFVENRITANILMFVFLVGGLFVSTKITQEFIPEFADDFINISVSYPGASPEEIEQGIILAVEESIRGVDGIKQITATATEGMGLVQAEILPRTSIQQVYQDIQQEVDRITTFPLDIEEKTIFLEIRRREVVDIQLYGDTNEWNLRELAEQTHDALLQHPSISQVELSGIREFEVQVEVSQNSMRRYGLTLQDIALKIRNTAIEIPGGSIDTSGGKILLRFTERRDWAKEFSQIPIISTEDGRTILLEDIARVQDGFENSDNSATYNNLPAIGIQVYRIGTQTPLGVSEATREVLQKLEQTYPPGIHYAINRDLAEVYQQRLELLVRNGVIGLCFVLLILGTFLEHRLAFWVTVGIPTAFMGAFLFLPLLGVTINMISMFAFIIALGIVVDDAIVAGENVYEYRQRGYSYKDAAIEGARNVALPISFSILTNIVAFLPLLFMPGMMGKIWSVIPLVVTTVFIISWVESLFILPTHLSHRKTSSKPSKAKAYLYAYQNFCASSLNSFVDKIFAPWIHVCIKNRYLTVSIALFFLLGISGYALSGRLGFELMPKVESDSAVVTAILPVDAPRSRLEQIRSHLINASHRVSQAHGGTALHSGTFGIIKDNTVEVVMYLTSPDTRPLSTAKVTELWREELGEISGLQSLRFESDRGGPGRGPTITVELSHRDISVLNKASNKLAKHLATFPNVNDIDDGYTVGKEQLDFELTEAGRNLGITSSEIARQIRNSFFGSEALRQQRGRNQVRVMVRLPEEERESEYYIENLIIKTPLNREVPLFEIAKVKRGRSYTSISRRDGKRTLSVTANVTPQSEAPIIIEDIKKDFLPSLTIDHPGLSYSFEGKQAELRESLQSLLWGFVLALICIYVLLAIPFKSYLQPAIVMTAIPFGIIGAVIGHYIMGYSMSIISMMGIVALTGVVVNDSLVIIDYANNKKRDGSNSFDAISGAARRRFRPILLTTLTTFFGLAPMIFETSRQARFMIPMALSLGYGIVFATGIILIIIPCLYIILDDIKGFFGFGDDDVLSTDKGDKGDRKLDI
jgi:multidrug efflux pump subunit AcrB